VQEQRDLKRARYDFLLAALRLKASTGSLTDEDIAGVNALLDPAVPLTVPDVNTPERAPSSDGAAGPSAGTHGAEGQRCNAACDDGAGDQDERQRPRQPAPSAPSAAN